MNAKKRRPARQRPTVTDEAKWMQAAKDMISRYDGDTERLVMELLISHELEVQQVDYLQGEIEKIGKMYPGLFKLAYHEPGARPGH